VDDTSVLVRYTYFGDGDLDGDVYLEDVGPWAVNFTGELGGSAAATKVWNEGDWDYDGDVDLDDVGKWSTNFTGELGGTGLGAAVLSIDASGLHPTALGVLQGLGVTLVPEPSTAAGLALLGLGVARRRPSASRSVRMPSRS
jgi:hypothetical protein